MTSLVQAVEKTFMKKKFPRFNIGDTVRVQTRIIEGDKERTQAYQGVVVARNGNGISATFTVYRVAFGYANEKVFPIHSPNVTSVEVLKRGDVRKSKLNYIRGKVGKAAKIRSKFGLDEATEETFVEDDAVAPVIEEPKAQDNSADSEGTPKE